jgi:hypothetical protein
MAVLVPIFFGAAGAAVAVTAGASIATAALVGVGAAIVSHKTGAADWVYDNIVKPVGKAVKRVLTSDIGQFVTKAAALLTGNAWAIPLIDGATTLANGGSFGDALKSAAISYVGGKVGNLAGELASQTMVNAGASAFATQLVSSAAGSGAGRATVALVMGQDPVKAFIQGGISGGISAAAGWLETNTEGAFSKLPPVARNVITSGLSAALTGQELTPDLIWNALLTSEGVTKTVNTFLGENLGLAQKLTDNQLSALTLGIQRTAATAFSGGNVPDVILSQLSQYGEKEFVKWLDNSKFGDAVNNSIDKITGDYQRAQAQAEKMDGVVKSHSGAVDKYNATVKKINDGVTKQEALRTDYERALKNFQANESQANAEKLDAAVKAFNTHVTAFNKEYEKTLKPNLDLYEQQVANFEAQFEKESKTYDDLVDDLSVASDRIAEDLKPVYNELDRTFVKFMDPNFNEAEYRKIAGLGKDEDAYLHWLSTGKEQGLPTNLAAYNEEYGAYRQRVVNSVLERAGLSLADMTKGERAAFLANIDKQYPTLQALRDAPTQTLANNLLTNKALADRVAAQDYVAGVTTITPAINDALKRAGLKPGMVGEYLTQDDITGLTKPRVQTAETIGRQTGITDQDIATGAARLTVNNEGLLEWGRLELNTPYWDAESNRLVKRVYVEQGTQLDGSYVLVDAVTGTRVGGLQLDITKAQNLTDLQETDPSLFIQAVGGLSKAAGAIIDTQVGQAVSEFARNVVEYAKTSPGIMNTAGIALEAGGELLDTFNNMVLLANINPASTPLGAFARDMLALGGDMKTPEWKAAVTRMNTRMAEGEGWEKVASVWGGFQEAPVQFLAEIIGKEILQEIPVLLVSGGTGNVTKRLLSTAGEQVAKDLSRRATLGTAATLDLAESFGGAAGSAYDSAFTTARQSGMSEAEAEAYARDVAISAGMVGVTTTLISMGVMDGNAFEKSILARTDSGDTAKAFDLLTRRVTEGASVTWKEGVQESIEEGLPTLFTETVLAQIDPDRDVLGSVLQAATLGAVAGSGTAGGIYTGYATADALIRTNAAVRNAIARGGSNPQAAITALTNLGLTDKVAQNNLLSTVNTKYHSNGDVSRAFSAHPDFRVTNADILNGVLNATGQNVTTYINTYVDQRYVDIEEVKAAAAAEGVKLTDAQAQDMVTQTDNPNATQAALYSIQQKYDPQAVTKQEATAAFTAQGFKPSDAQIAQFVREGKEADVLKELEAYVDPRQVTTAEATQFFANLGYKPTAQEIKDFVGQGDEKFEGTAPTRVETYVNPRQVTKEEARKFFEELGYTPTDAQVTAFVAQVKETTQKEVISKYVDPRQVTRDELQAIAAEEGLTLTEALAQTYIGQSASDTFERKTLTTARAEYDPLATTLAEATQFFANTGYAATTKEIAQFVASKTEEAQTSAIGAYVNPRQVTEAEAKEFLSAIGYNPTKEEIKRFVGQANDANFQVTQRAEIDAYVDPRYVDAGEIRAAYEALGLVDVSQEDVDRFVGQFDEEKRLGEVRDYLPTATFNVIKQILGSPGVEDDPNTEADESKPATGIYAELEAGATRDEALKAAIEKVAGNLNTTKEALLEELGLTETRLLEEIDNVASDLSDVKEDVADVKEDVAGVKETLTDVEASILDRVDELETAGIKRDEALSTAIGDLATELGLTEESLLEQIGLTEEELLTEIGAAEERLGTQFTGDLQFVADLVGKPARDVTQVDVDFVADLIAQQEVITDLSMSQRQYDVTGDGQITQDDFALLEQALAGTDVTFAPGSIFGPATGIYAQQEQNLAAQLAAEAETQKQIEAQIQNQTELATQLQTQMSAQDEAARRRAFGDFVRQQQDVAGQRVDVRTPDPMRINYLYDFQSIFATPQQSSLFPSPYAKGGQVEGTTDKLLRIIGELK